MSNPFRTPGKTVSDGKDPDAKLKAFFVRKLAGDALIKKQEKLEAKMANQCASKFWLKKVHPDIMEDAKKGRTSTCVLDVSKNLAVALIVHGQGLGFRIHESNNNLHISW